MICAWLELRFVTIKRRNPIDFGRFRSEGGGGTVDPDRQLQEIIHNFTKKGDISVILGSNERSGIGDLG